MAKGTAPAAGTAVPLAQCSWQVPAAGSSDHLQPGKQERAFPFASKYELGPSRVSHTGGQEGSFAGAAGQCGVGAELGSGWVWVASPQRGLRGATITLSTLRPCLIFLSLLFHFFFFFVILHIKICVGSQKRAASTQYSTQWRGLGIGGSVLWDLDFGG